MENISVDNTYDINSSTHTPTIGEEQSDEFSKINKSVETAVNFVEPKRCITEC